MSHSESQSLQHNQDTWVQSPAPEVPKELSQLLQTLFDTLDDYVALDAVLPEASARAACQRAVYAIARTLRLAHWSVEDATLLLQECVRHLAADAGTAADKERAKVLVKSVPHWAVQVYRASRATM